MTFTCLSLIVKTVKEKGNCHVHNKLFFPKSYPGPTRGDYRGDRLRVYRAGSELYLDNDRSDDRATRLEDPGFPLEGVHLAESLTDVPNDERSQRTSQISYFL